MSSFKNEEVKEVEEVEEEVENPLLEFYSLLGDLKKSHPEFTKGMFRDYFQSNMKGDLDALVKSFKEDFALVPDEQKLDLIIALEDIGITIPRSDSDDLHLDNLQIVNEEDEGDEW